MATGEMNPFLAEVLATRGGRNVLQCYQCGTCSGSCPVLEDMEYGPRRIVYMVQNGMEREVLSSVDIWRCVSCYSCMNRCPRGIEITDLMADLRRLAIQKGYAQDKEAVFGQSFAETFVEHGRLFEPELLMRYYLRAWDMIGLLGMIPVGLKMFLKGKIAFVPEQISDPTEMEKINVIPQKEGTDYVSRIVSVMVTVMSLIGGIGLILFGRRESAS